MGDVSIRNVNELDRHARGLLEALLGRRLSEQEQVGVMAFPPHAAPSEVEREVAVEQLSSSVQAMSARAQGVPADELESLIDEAVDQARGRRP